MVGLRVWVQSLGFSVGLGFGVLYLALPDRHVEPGQVYFGVHGVLQPRVLAADVSTETRNKPESGPRPPQDPPRPHAISAEPNRPPDSPLF